MTHCALLFNEASAHLETLMKLTDPREVSKTMSCSKPYHSTLVSGMRIPAHSALRTSPYIFIEDDKRAEDSAGPSSMLLTPQMRMQRMPKWHRQPSKEVPMPAALRWHAHAKTESLIQTR